MAGYCVALGEVGYTAAVDRSKTLPSAGMSQTAGGSSINGAETDGSEKSDSVSSRAQTSGEFAPASSELSPRRSFLPLGMILAHRYKIERFIARGGMGEVYLARDEVLGEAVALKTVGHYSEGSEAIDQLKAEVQLARRVSHRNVCRIYDLGTDRTAPEAPMVFLSMEFVVGRSLARYLEERGRLAPPEALRIGCGILAGLEAAHDAGVLHRDLKTDNVMLREQTDRAPEPVLMDFGLASALNPNSSRISADASWVGTLAYMAPEQVQGAALRVTTDLYAFGVILFEMLTGRLPFEAATPAMSAILRLQEDAPKLRSCAPELPAGLEAVVARCLQRDPKRRYPSARDILIALNEEEAVASVSTADSEEAATAPSSSRSTPATAPAPPPDAPTPAKTPEATGANVSDAGRERVRLFTIAAVVLLLSALLLLSYRGAHSGSSEAEPRQSAAQPAGADSTLAPGLEVASQTPPAAALVTKLAPGPSAALSVTDTAPSQEPTLSRETEPTPTPKPARLRPRPLSSSASTSAESTGAESTRPSDESGRACPEGLLCPDGLKPRQ